MKQKKTADSRGLLLSYLRAKEGLSQGQLAEKVGLVANDICRFEHGRLGRVWKYRELAKYFGISVDTLVRDDIQAVAAELKDKIVVSHRPQEEFQRKEALKIRVGFEGEDIIAEAERASLAGTAYANAVNPCYAESADAGFDILSFTPDGQPRYIEVKTTNQPAANTSFIMTANELNFMNYCREKGLLYEIHRVYALKNRQDWKRVVYTLEDMEDFEFIPRDYRVRRCRKK